MRAMRDSGVEWIGEIPEGWETRRLRYLASFESGATPSKDIDEYWAGDIPWISSMEVKEDVIYDTSLHISEEAMNSCSTRLLPAGTLVMVVRSGVLQHTIPVALTGAPMTVNQDIKAITFNDQMMAKYFFYFVRGCNDNLLKVLMKGKSTVDNLSVDYLIDLRIPMPPLDKQRQIVSYLDARCADIDAVSQKVRSEIDLLGEYRKSVIYEAVTKGLDKGVPMRDSGVEWIGDIPKGWDTLKGKYVFEQRNEKGNRRSLRLLSPTQNYGVIPQDMYEELTGMRPVKLKQDTDLNTLKTIHKGDFCISLRSFQGGFEYSEYEGVVSPAYQVFYPIINVFDGYYRHLFKTSAFIDKMNSYTMSMRDGKNIAFDDFGNTLIPIPPLDEQRRIADYLDARCADIDAVIAKKRRQLDVLADYRKSLIYEYVTGKREVA